MSIKTKFGSAYLDNGYYRIGTRNEHRGKLLHRLIYEDHHKVTLSPQDEIHHIDRDTQNNSIDNLELLTKAEHSRKHMQGKDNPMYGKYGELNPWYGKRGEKNPFYKPYARVVKSGFTREGKQLYQLTYKGEAIKHSVFKEKLEKMAKELNEGESKDD